MSNERKGHMHKDKVRTRDIYFFSQKSNQMMCVHSERAREHARRLEEDGGVESYEVNVQLNIDQYPYLSAVDIRASYFQTQWTSDFMVRYRDGRREIQEIVNVEDLKKRAVIEKLELSRRYWELMQVSKWRVVLESGGEVG